MKLLVVSDVHGDLDALERAVDAEADADAVFFWETVCGKRRTCRICARS